MGPRTDNHITHHHVLGYQLIHCACAVHALKVVYTFGPTDWVGWRLARGEKMGGAGLRVCHRRSPISSAK